MKSYFQLLVVLSLFLNLLLLSDYFEKPFVPTYHQVKTIYDRTQDESYRNGYLLTDFEVKTTEVKGYMELVYVAQRGYFPDMWCFDKIVYGSEPKFEGICEKYWEAKKTK